ncbi:DUF6350 family protein [Nocardioides euryhalodurans]|uniref:Uncharacterized protein n=1 Tax=Nocardioides euryhalodurans TaxID=2518370 RepID=A0A4P7GJA1_9ACTN|nr:DUF6350 family protein [Nocardioides euryhalodurans]QBR92108.1 hypothetical protein EXE57_07305 [Nocardioides euryhalodurans]
MTSLLSAPDRAAAPSVDPRHRRPLALVATLGGVVAASSLLVVCLGVGVTGWFLSDAGTHGQPRDGLRVGALAWLMGHGSTVTVDGVVVTAVPLLLTLAAAWLSWRVGHRVGDSISGHGPDSDQISDGERDWTVPVAAGFFVAGYAAVVLLTHVLAATPATAPSLPRSLGWSLVLALGAGGSAIAVGSGRAAIWTAVVPAELRATAATAVAVLRAFLLVSFVALLVALVLDLGTAANIVSGLGLEAGEATVFLGATALVLPNATLFAGSYLLGPGFTVGTGTMVSPTLVVTGPLPAFPLLAALPDSGPVPVWTVGLLAVPVLAAALAAARAQRRRPTLRWEQGALRGCAGGVAAGLLLGGLALLAGGAVGPGRMTDVAPLALDVLVHAVTSFGIGGLVGGVVATGLARRRHRAGTAVVQPG